MTAKPAAFAALVGATLVALSGTASAAWTATKTGGRGFAKATTMPTGGTPSAPATSTGPVTVTWTQAQLAGSDVATYTVRRYVGSTPTTVACATLTFSNHVASCSYTETTSGTYTYTDTPTAGLWTGTESAKSGNTVVAFDTTAPNAPTILFPAANGLYRAATWQALSGTASDNTGGSGVASTEVQVKGTVGANANRFWTGTAWSATAGWVAATGTSSWSYSGLTGANLPADGTYTVQARTTDVAGNGPTAGGVVTFKLDATAPTAPVAAKVGYTDRNNLTADEVTGTAGAVEANATVTVTQTAPSGKTGTFTGTADATGAFTVAVSAVAGTSQTTITASFSLTATDAAGNTSTPTTASFPDNK